MPINRHALTADQQLRMEALRLAMSLSNLQLAKGKANSDKESVLQTAKMFYIFARGEYDEPAGRDD